MSVMRHRTCGKGTELDIVLRHPVGPSHGCGGTKAESGIPSLSVSCVVLCAVPLYSIAFCFWDGIGQHNCLVRHCTTPHCNPFYFQVMSSIAPDGWYSNLDD